jgi:hypothetical protein
LDLAPTTPAYAAGSSYHRLAEIKARVERLGPEWRVLDGGGRWRGVSGESVVAGGRELSGTFRYYPHGVTLTIAVAGPVFSSIIQKPAPSSTTCPCR